jgi:hypothetical protein
MMDHYVKGQFRGIAGILDWLVLHDRILPSSPSSDLQLIWLDIGRKLMDCRVLNASGSIWNLPYSGTNPPVPVGIMYGFNGSQDSMMLSEH